MFSTLSFNFLNWQQFVYEMLQTRRQKLSRLFHQIFSLCSSIVSGHVTWSHVSGGMMHVTIIAPPTITSIQQQWVDASVTSNFYIRRHNLTWDVKFDFKFHILEAGWPMNFHWSLRLFGSFWCRDMDRKNDFARHNW